MDPDAESDATTNDATPVAVVVRTEEEKNLDRLALFHYLLGLLTALLALPLIPYLLSAWEIAHWIGQPALSQRAEQLLRWVRFLPGANRPEVDDQLLGLTLLVAIIPTMALLLMHGVLLACVGRWLARRRKYKTTFVISLFNLTNAPLGTALSAITLVLLMRPAVKKLYAPKPKPAGAEPCS